MIDRRDMTGREDIYANLRYRLDTDVAHYGGALPDRPAVAWRGYLAAMLEWGLISVAEHDALLRLLPEIPDDPVVDILLGRD
jgi:hypothetical protein